MKFSHPYCFWALIYTLYACNILLWLQGFASSLHCQKLLFTMCFECSSVYLLCFGFENWSERPLHPSSVADLWLDFNAVAGVFWTSADPSVCSCLRTEIKVFSFQLESCAFKYLLFSLEKGWPNWSLPVPEGATRNRERGIIYKSM